MLKKIEQKIIEFIKRNSLIKPNDKIIVGFSGGPDSVFALSFLSKYKKKFQIELAAIHINHNLRGKDSIKDEEFSKEFCKKLGVKFFSDNVDVKSFAKKNKLSIEEAARKIRYDKFTGIADATGFNKIVTAHNKNDNTETVLLNFLTGTGITGCSGIPIHRENIIRPFLCLTKEEIILYLKSRKINFRIDKTNLRDDFKRNFLRNQVVPLLKKKVNPQLDDAVFRSSKNIEAVLPEIEKSIMLLAGKFFSTENGQLKIDSSVFNSDLKGLFGDALKNELRKNFNFDFSFHDLFKIEKLNKLQKGKQIHLASNLKAFREDKHIIIKPSNFKKEEKETIIKTGENVEFANMKIGIESVEAYNVTFQTDKSIEFINTECADDIFILRKWKNGDKFIPLGMKKFKKVSDFLTDLKIPTSERKNKLVLVNRNHIVWVVGLRIDNRYKITNETRKIYKLWMK